MSAGHNDNLLHNYDRSEGLLFESCGQPSRGRRGREFPVAQFVENFSIHEGLLSEELITKSELGRKCVQKATRARNEFHDLIQENEPYVNIAWLSPTEKYLRRVRNNRKSAAGTRVYEEVLEQELVNTLQRASATNVSLLDESANTFRQENERLRQEEKELKNALQAEEQTFSCFDELHEWGPDNNLSTTYGLQRHPGSDCSPKQMSLDENFAFGSNLICGSVAELPDMMTLGQSPTAVQDINRGVNCNMVCEAMVSDGDLDMLHDPLHNRF